MFLLPTRKQWKGWSLPSKLGAIGTYLGILTTIIAIIPWLSTLTSKDKQPTQSSVLTTPADSANLVAKTGENQFEDVYMATNNYELIFDTLQLSYYLPDTRKVKKWWDSTVRYDIDVPIIKYKENSFVEGKIRRLIEHEFATWGINVGDLKMSEWPGTFKTSYDVKYKIHNLVGIRLNIDWHGQGAAHSNSTITTFNINLVNGRTFKYGDIFDPARQNELTKLIVTKIRLDSCYCLDLNHSLDSLHRRGRDFYFNDHAIVLVFSQGEISCNACGPIEIPIDFEELTPFIAKKGPLSFLEY